MPGQLFNLSRYFKKNSNPPVGTGDPSLGNQQVVTSTVVSQPPVASGGTYSGIGYPQPQTPLVSQPPRPQIFSTASSANHTPIPLSSPPASAPQTSGAMTMQKRVGMDVLTRLTQRSTQALMNGVNKAKQLHVQYVDSEHVLFGVLADPSVYQLISDLKVTPKDLLEQLEKQFKPGKYLGPPQFSPRVKRVLELGLSAARGLGYEFVSPEHILLALAQEGEGLAAQIMAKTGLTVETLNKKITGKKEGVEGEKDEKTKASTLEQFTDDLTQKAREGKLDPVVARSSEIERVVHILSRRTKNNPVLIGEAGVGKTAIVEGLAQRIAQGDVPETLLNRRILQLDLMSLIAGARHRGEFEERLKNLIKEVKAASGQIILFIDEIHNMVGAGSGSEGTMDASNILKPSLARGELQTIGTTTITEYRRFIEKDPALERRFQPILVPEPTYDQAIDMVRALRDKYEAFHKVSIPDEALEAAVKLSQRYVGDRFLPDKAVDLMDEAAAAVRLPAISLPEEIKAMTERMKRLETEKKETEKTNDSVRLTTLNRDIEELTRELEEKKQAYEVKKSTTTNVVSPEVIQEIVSRWTNIPISKLTESESEKLLKLEDVIHKRIVDQENAVSSVAEAVRRGRAGLKSNKRPIGSFIFMGPTGVGKTELAKALAEILFGSDEMMVRLDMTEYMEKHEVAKLIGAPPGYVGYEEGGQLTEAVRRHPYSVVLLDEIEKAHPDVFNILIQVLDDGRLTDNKGHLISFKNTIVICTSNLGTGLIQNDMVETKASSQSAVSAFSTYVYSPTGRQMVTLGKRLWELDIQAKPFDLTQGKSEKHEAENVGNSSPNLPNQPNKTNDAKVVGWITKLLSDYFAGNTITQANPSDQPVSFPESSIDTHVISPTGEEMMTSGGRFWLRKSTTSKEWISDTLITYFKSQQVINALPDQPDQQLPTATIDTNAIAPNEIQVVTLGNRFWRKENLTVTDWMTGLCSDYLKDSVVVGAAEEKSADQSDVQALGVAGRIVRDAELQLPTQGWDNHILMPTGEEIIVAGMRFWKRPNIQTNEWTTDTLANLFTTTAVSNATADHDDEQLPVGAEIKKAQELQESKEEEKFAELADKLMEELKKFFRPELLNRFDEVIVFRPLSQKHMMAIVTLQLAILAKLLEEQNIGLTVSKSACNQLGTLGYDPIYGARPLRRTIQREIENPISSILIEGKLKAGDTVAVDFDGNAFTFTPQKQKVTASPDQTQPASNTPHAFVCKHCSALFDSEVVEHATTICPRCASIDLVERTTSIGQPASDSPTPTILPASNPSTQENNPQLLNPQQTGIPTPPANQPPDLGSFYGPPDGGPAQPVVPNQEPPASIPPSQTPEPPQPSQATIIS